MRPPLRPTLSERWPLLFGFVALLGFGLSALAVRQRPEWLHTAGAATALAVSCDAPATTGKPAGNPQTRARSARIFAKTVPGGSLTIRPIAKDHVTGYAQQWNLDVQTQVSRLYVLTVAYSGSKGTEAQQGQGRTPCARPGDSTAQRRARFLDIHISATARSGGVL